MGPDLKVTVPSHSTVDSWHWSVSFPLNSFPDWFQIFVIVAHNKMIHSFHYYYRHISSKINGIISTTRSFWILMHNSPKMTDQMLHRCILFLWYDHDLWPLVIHTSLADAQRWEWGKGHHPIPPPPPSFLDHALIQNVCWTLPTEIVQKVLIKNKLIKD